MITQNGYIIGDDGMGLAPGVVTNVGRYMGRDEEPSQLYGTVPFNSKQELRDLTDRMDEVGKVPLYRISHGMGTDFSKTDRFATVSKRFNTKGEPLDHRSDWTTRGRMYDVVSDRYTVAQDESVFGALNDALDNVGATDVVGMVRGLGSGKTTVDAFIMDKDAQFDVTDIGGDKAYMGVRVWNGHNGRSSVGMGFRAVRGFCTNGMVFGANLIGEAWSRHDIHVDVLVDSFEETITDGINNVHSLEDVFRSAQARLMTPEEYEAALWGVGFTEGHRDELINNMSIYAPEVEVDGITAFTAHAAMTSYLSHGNDTARYYNTTERRLAKTADVITNSDTLDRIINKGREDRQRGKAKQTAKTPVMEYQVAYR